MGKSHFDRFNASIQRENTSVATGESFNMEDLDEVVLRLDRVRSLGGLFAHVELSDYTKARMGIAPASEYMGDVLVHELEAVSV